MLFKRGWDFLPTHDFLETNDIVPGFLAGASGLWPFQCLNHKFLLERLVSTVPFPSHSLIRVKKRSMLWFSPLNFIFQRLTICPMSFARAKLPPVYELQKAVVPCGLRILAWVSPSQVEPTLFNGSVSRWGWIDALACLPVRGCVAIVTEESAACCRCQALADGLATRNSSNCSSGDCPHGNNYMKKTESPCRITTWIVSFLYSY